MSGEKLVGPKKLPCGSSQTGNVSRPLRETSTLLPVNSISPFAPTIKESFGEPEARRADHGAGTGEGSHRVGEIQRVLRLVRDRGQSLKQSLVDKSDRINLGSVHRAGVEV